MTMGRLLIVSNRLPVTVRSGDDGFALERSTGGLATGLSTPHQHSEGIWIGWPGLSLEELGPQLPALEARLAEERLIPIHLTREQVERHYAGFANGVIWPVFHYLTGQIPLATDDWEAYQEVNRRFADRVAELWEPDDTIWIHDFHLLLVPGLLRARLPAATIGLFLHIPFPAAEMFQTVPGSRDLIEGMLGADLIGFHTASYVHHFSRAALRLAGRPTEVDEVRLGGRTCKLLAHPMGVDAERIAALAATPEVHQLVAEHRGTDGGRIMLGIDRLDYTKGLPRRLLAFERMLIRYPELRGQVRLVTLVVPSREDVGAYQEFRGQIDMLIGRINGAFATPTWTPVHYMFRSLPEQEVVALYRAADVMLVTPIRDGMNLVSKEYVAARPDEDGVLVLSEFAGAAAELVEAVLINPYEVAACAERYHEALTMNREERWRRMRALRTRVAEHDVHWWVREFLRELEHAAAHRSPPAVAEDPEGLVRAVEELAHEARLAVILDYDGTLISFHLDPELAVPDAALTSLLRRLATRPDTDVHIVSGRPRVFLAQWLGDLPVHLHAEHGGWSRPRGSEVWQPLMPFTLEWRELLEPVLEEFASRTPGAFVERKELGLGWHWRAADPDIGARHANELGLYLLHLAGNLPVDVLFGNHVIELRPQGVSKADIAQRVLADLAPGTAILAAGDDRTDEDLFAALPRSAYTIHVGSRSSRARFTLPSPTALRGLLARLVPQPGGPAPVSK